MAQIINPSFQYHPNNTLGERVPIRDEQGQYLCDFMMLVRGLRSMPKAQMEQKITLIYGVLGWFDKTVVFADLNMKLNLLWVSLKPKPDICLRVSGAITLMVPEAVLIGPMTEDMWYKQK